MRKGLNRIESVTLVLFGVLFLGALTLSSCAGRNTEELEQRDQQIQQLQSDVDQMKQQIGEREKEIENLERKNTELQRRVLEPYVVKKGDSDWKIGYDYLTKEKKVAPKEAEKMLSNAVLFDPILEGYEAWNFSNGEAYGGFFTKNEASVSPGALERMEANRAKEELDTLQRRVAELRDEMGRQRQEMTTKLQQVERLREEGDKVAERLESEVSSLQDYAASLKKQNETLDSRLNSVYYLAGSKHELEAEGKIEDPLFGPTRIETVTSSDFENRLDLRDTTVIALQAGDLGLSTIKDVELLPQGYQKGVDYRVDIAPNQQSAEVHLLNEDRFRLASIVVVVD